MSKTLLAVFTVIAISGCQVQQLLETLPVTDNDNETIHSCSIENIDELVMFEHQFQQSDAKTKSERLIQAKEKNQTAVHAILLSQPDHTTAQLKNSIELFEQLELGDAPTCETEKYLQVRHQYTQAVLTLQRALNTADLERKQLSAERDKLKQQIDALTRIENDLSRQKDGEEKK